MTAPSDPELAFRSFAEFWPYYLREHGRPVTRWVHFVGTTLAFVLAGVILAFGAWWWALAIPVCGYGFAWFSHLALEHNRPATFKFPWWSLRGDFRMWALMASGRMNRELARVAREAPQVADR